jgi:peptidyl-prolyl cis-trans isomerase SurA
VFRITRGLKVTCALGVSGLAMTLLGACSPAQMGAAAMVGGQRITTDDLNSAVGEWQKAYNANPLPSSELRLLDTSSIPRSVLYNLVVFKLADVAAKRQGVNVTDGTVDKAIAAVGGESRVADEAVVTGVPPQRARDYARFQLDVQGIAGALGEDRRQPALRPLRLQPARHRVGLLAPVPPRVAGAPRPGLTRRGPRTPIITELGVPDAGPSGRPLDVAPGRARAADGRRVGRVARRRRGCRA